MTLQYTIKKYSGCRTNPVSQTKMMMIQQHPLRVRRLFNQEYRPIHPSKRFVYSVHNFSRRSLSSCGMASVPTTPKVSSQHVIRNIFTISTKSSHLSLPSQQRWCTARYFTSKSTPSSPSSEIRVPFSHLSYRLGTSNSRELPELPKGLALINNFVSKNQQNSLESELSMLFERQNPPISAEFRRAIINLHGKKLKSSLSQFATLEQIISSPTLPVVPNSLQLNAYFQDCKDFQKRFTNYGNFQTFQKNFENGDSAWSCPFHVDAKSIGNTIVMMGLKSSAVLELRKDHHVWGILMEPGSLLIMEEESRSDYEHGIVRTDKFDFQPLDNSKLQTISKRDRMSLVLWKTLEHKQDEEDPQNDLFFDSPSFLDGSLDNHHILDDNTRQEVPQFLKIYQKSASKARGDLKFKLPEK